MALFSIRNERDLIVASAVATETTAGEFAASASAGEIQVVNEWGNAPVGKGKFYFLVKHLDGRLRASDVIDPNKIISLATKTAVSPVLPKSVVTVVTATVGDLYEIIVKIHNDGALSPENCVFLNGSYTAVTGDDVTAIADGLVASLNAAQKRMGQTYFTITNTDGAITLQSTKLPFVTGKKDGRALDYSVKFTQVNPKTLEYTLTGTIVNTGLTANPCDPDFLRDLEYQTRGAFGDSLRGLAYPFDFNLQSDVSTTAAYDTYSLIEIQFYDGDKNDHAVQKSPRSLTVACAAADLAALKATIDVAVQALDLSTAATDGQVITWSDTTGTYAPADLPA